MGSQRYYFTFGWGQEHFGGFHVIEADTQDAAVAEMKKRFGDRWAHVYGSPEAAGVHEFALDEIE